MVVFPNCKINIGLRILRKRNDGYHDLETVFYSIPVCDALEAVHGNAFQFQQTGLTVETPHEKNLCVKAYQLLKDQFPQLPPVHLHLHKNIPMGAGLGGGSADAAFTLLLLNNKFQLGISNERLLDLALQLGSDCPYFIINRPSFASGRGEFLEPVSLDLSGYSFLLVHPQIHVSTAEAFSLIRPGVPVDSLKQLVQQPITEWRDRVINDFETPLFEKHPVLAEIKNKLYQGGALFASLSGSGSSIYGIFEKNSVPSWLAEELPYRLDTIL